MGPCLQLESRARAPLGSRIGQMSVGPSDWGACRLILTWGWRSIEPMREGTGYESGWRARAKGFDARIMIRPMDRP